MRNHFLRAAATAPAYVTDDLAFHIDAGNSLSYLGSGTTVYNLIHNDSSSSFNQYISHSSSDGGYWSFGSTTGHGIEFEIGGNNNYLDIGSNDFTIEMWMKPTNLNFLGFNIPLEYVQKVPQSNYEFNDYQQFLIFLLNINNQGVIQLRTYYNARPDNSVAYFYGTNFISTTWQNNTSWLHYVLTSDVNVGSTSGTRRIYKNGQSLSYLNASDYNFVRNATNNQLHIGGNSNAGGAFPFLGDISIVRIYNGKALSSTEVTQNYNAEKSRYGY